MEKTNFENLEIYQLSEKLADEIWEIVLAWNNLAIQSANKLFVLLTVSARILQKEADAELCKTIADFCEWQEARFMKQDIGFAAHTKENFYLKKIPKSFYLL
jgi:hypothetical protein